MTSKSFGLKAAIAPTTLAGKSYGSETDDLRDDVEEAFVTNEARTGFPEIDWIDGGAPAAAGGDAVIKGRNLLQGQTFASYDVDSTHGLIFTALKPGLAQNSLTIQIVAGAATSVAKTGNAIVITFNDGVDDSDAVATAVNANAADTDGYLRAASSGMNAAGLTAGGSVAATALTGGTGAGFECLVSGTEALPANTTGTSGAAAISDTTVTVTVPDLTALGDARAATDIAAITIESDGIKSLPITFALA